MEKFYVTTPIYYANAEPHIGSAYTTVSADILARYYRVKLGKDNVFSLVGTDEHGQKIFEEACGKNSDPKSYVDALVPTFKRAWKLLNIDYDVFMRTTDPLHENEVKKVIQNVYNNGHIYSGVYEGLYCVGCEKFLTEKDLVNNRCPLHPNKKPVFQKEKNYFFKLSSFQDRLIDLFESEEVKILPKHRRKEILNRIKEGLEDVSISREGVSWGIPIPWDKTHTIYVWMEALLNYYTATKTEENRDWFWPVDLHIVGKDILWFHTVIWCALLLAAKLPLPKIVFGHGFLILAGQKISKSLGNVISPQELVTRYGVDGTRYLLATATTFGDDRDIKEGEFDGKYTADLANGLGNLIARVAAMSVNFEFRIQNSELKISKRVAEKLEAYEFDKALEIIWKRIKECDALINEREVWKLQDKEKQEVLITLIDEIRQIGVDLQPFLPKTAEEILKRFRGSKIMKGEALFPRLDR